jgi:hypothetical protein
MTVVQCRVSARNCRIWRCQRAASRTSQREGAFWDSVVATVVAALVVVPGPVSVFLEAVAAAAAVVRPANASRSPQARIERRKSFPS